MSNVDQCLSNENRHFLNSSRNSSKTLKCPKCNWHYKYPETLEIHLKEKHQMELNENGECLENSLDEKNCSYCQNSVEHPRLSRGEQYSCGFKPYRCDLCLYSTTTKGNLAIHMQSDKHFNNSRDFNSSSDYVLSPSSNDPKNSQQELFIESSGELNVERMTNNDQYRCHRCPEICFSNFKHLFDHLQQENHLEDDSNEMNCWINQCQQKFSSIDFLRDHLEKFHGKSFKDFVNDEKSFKNEKIAEEAEEEDEERKKSSISSLGLGLGSSVTHGFNFGSTFGINHLNKSREKLISLGEDLVQHYLENLSDSINDQRELICDYCLKKFSNLSTLKIHYEEIHSNRLSSRVIDHWIFILEKLHQSSSNENPSSKRQSSSSSSSFRSDPFLNEFQRKKFRFDRLTDLNDDEMMDYQSVSNGKRRRTRITDEQLNILRSHFDINNSPSDDQIHLIAEKSHLSSKVIKHWFRNTLFKERQKNKDSPYNFSNPPASNHQLDLDQYQKTGLIIKKSSSSSISNPLNNDQQQQEHFPSSSMMKISSSSDDFDKDDFISNDEQDFISNDESNSDFDAHFKHHHHRVPPSSTIFSSSSTPSYSLNVVQQTNPSRRANRTRFTDEQLKYLQDAFESNPYPKDDDLEILSTKLKLNSRVIVVWFQNARQKARKSYENHQIDSNEQQQQTHFDQLFHPKVSEKDKDKDKEKEKEEGYACKHCSKFFSRFAELMKHTKQCSLAPSLPKKSSSSFVTKKDSSFPPEQSMKRSKSTTLDYSSSSSSFVDPSKTFDPQTWINAASLFPFAAAAAAAAAATSNSSSSSSSTSTSSSNATALAMNVAFQAFNHLNSQYFHPSNPQTLPSSSAILPYYSLPYLGSLATLPSSTSLPTKSLSNNLISKSTSNSIEEKQKEKDKDKENSSLKPLISIGSNSSSNDHDEDLNESNEDSNDRSARVDGNHHHHHDQENDNDNEEEDERDDDDDDEDDDDDDDQSTFSSNDEEKSSSERKLKKRYRTTILPEQQDYLIWKYSQESNPSRKMLEDISAQVKLKKRVVQVWFQNTRARERKGIFKIDSQEKKSSSLSLSQQQQQHPYSSLEIHSNKSSSSSSSSMIEDLPLDLSKSSSTNRTDCVDGREKKRMNDQDDDDDGDGDGDEREFHRKDFSKSKKGSLVISSRTNECLSPSDSQQSSIIPNGQRRFRTQMTPLQIKLMKTIFLEYRTPTMPECELLGKEIDLQKRVVQVWFQNARAKEKKNPNFFKSDLPEEYQSNQETCRICQCKYTLQNPQRDHLFTSKHIENIRSILLKENQNICSTSPMKEDSSSMRKKNSKIDLDSLSNNSVLDQTMKDCNQSFLSSLNFIHLMPLGLDPFHYGLIDPNLHGIPLSMLQIPREAFEKIFYSIQNDSQLKRIQYTQDGKSIEKDLSLIDDHHQSIEYQSIDVGFVCKRCHHVWPLYHSCRCHLLICWQLSSSLSSRLPSQLLTDEDLHDLSVYLFKIEQLLYRCIHCQKSSSTLIEYENHCKEDQHLKNKSSK